MSAEAIYQTTRALRRLLLTQLDRSQDGQPSIKATVTLLPPGDGLPNERGVNLYLYRVAESPAFRNRPWPGDRATPRSHVPALGLQLFYLLTPLGKQPDPSSPEEGDFAHATLGVAMQTLHEHPILNEVHLPGFDADLELTDFLRNSFEHIKISLLPLAIDDLSKIWAAINKPYRLSVAYEVSLVEIGPTQQPRAGGGVVTSTGLEVFALDAPRLEALAPTTGALLHREGSTIVQNRLQIAGSGLGFLGQTPMVYVGGQAATIAGSPAPTDRSLTVVLPGDLDAGPQADVGVMLNRRPSAPLPFMVSPWLASITPIRTALDPLVSGDQELKLVGSGFTTAPTRVHFAGPGPVRLVNIPAGSQTERTAPIPPELANGVYRVRVLTEDDGASNSRILQVLPRIGLPILVESAEQEGREVHRLTIGGARLGGRDVRLVIDGVSHQVGKNTAADTLVYTRGRLLDAGAHQLALNVDGHLSRSVVLEV